jgi:hypothetical protein
MPKMQCEAYPTEEVINDFADKWINAALGRQEVEQGGLVIAGILQPGYLPWLGFFEQMHRSDVFVIYDDVQYDKHSWRNRNRIKTANGPHWLTVPVLLTFDEHPLINQVRIDNGGNWRKKHFDTIVQNYSKAPFFRRYSPFFEEAYTRNWEYLIDLDMYFIMNLADCLGIERAKIVKSSAMTITGDRIGRLIAMCKRLKTDTFYEGASGKNYIDPERFLAEGVRVIFQDYRHPVYSQLYGEFIPYLSIIDLLFNHGEKSLSIVTNQV